MRRLLLAFLILVAGSSAGVAAYEDDDKACFSKTSTPDEGIGACTRVLQSGRLKGNNIATAHVWRGSFHTRKREWDQAIADFSEAIRRNPTDASPYNQRGSAHLEKFAFDKAIADFDQAIRLRPKSRGELQQSRPGLCPQGRFRAGARRHQPGPRARSPIDVGAQQPRSRL